MFGSPLSVSQQRLKGKRPSDMTLAQLHEWIDACDTMEYVLAATSARRAWTQSKRDAEQELARRSAKQP